MVARRWTKGEDQGQGLRDSPCCQPAIINKKERKMSEYCKNCKELQDKIDNIRTIVSNRTMLEQLDAFKLYDAFLTLMSGINMFSADNLRRVRDEIKYVSQYENEDEHLVYMARSIIVALETEIGSRKDCGN
jgi:hypothetical protein